MDARPHRASRAIEDMRLQLAVDRLVAGGALVVDRAFEADGALERVMAERALLGLDLEALRREARQQRRQAIALRRDAIADRYAAAAQRARAVTRRDPSDRPA